MRTSRILSVVIIVSMLGLAVESGFAAKENKRDRRVLFVSKSSGFEHSSIHRDGDRLGHVERVMMEIGARNGFEVVCTKDASLMNTKNLENFDTVMLYTTADLTKESKDGGAPMTQENRRELLDWIKAGGGFFGAHTATDTFHNFTPYIEMVGGEFLTHGKHQWATVKVVDPRFPSMVDLPIEFRIFEEYYINKRVNLLKNMHVLMMLDTRSMDEPKYKEIDPYPIAWCSNYGKGRVFVNPLGHFEHTWDTPWFQGIVAQALEWTFGDVPGDASPNYQGFIK